MSVIILSDELVHYEVLGRGKPLVFLHGWVGSWRYWISSMQSISINYRAYALDLWGFGDTTKNPDFYTLEHQVSLVAEFLENLGIGKIALVGHGLGAIVALLFVDGHPDLVDRLMLASLPISPEALNSRFHQSSPIELADWLSGHIETNDVVRSEAAKTDNLALQVLLEQAGKIDCAASLYHLTTPCMVIHGQNDPAQRELGFDQISELPESMHYIPFEQSGHFPMLDEPSKYNRLLVDFLSLNSGESPRQLQLKEEWKRRVR